MAAQRFVVRSLPSLLVGALVVLAARAQPGAPRPPAPGSDVSATAPDGSVVPARLASGPEPIQCPYGTLAYVDYSSTLTLPVGGFAWQPNAVTRTASSVSVVAGHSLPQQYQVVIAYLDALAPDPTLGSVPLERGIVTASPGVGWVDLPLSRPIVVAPAIPDAATLTAAVSVGRVSGSAPMQVAFSPNGPASLPPAVLQLGSTYQTLPGPHPVLAHSVCAPSPRDGHLRLLRDVFRANDVVPTATAEVIQTFTVPVTATAEWVELAIASVPQMPTTPPMVVMIIDPGTLQTPTPDPFPATTTATTLDQGSTGLLTTPVWAPTYRFPAPVRLEASRTYWLVVQTSSEWGLRADASPGGSDYPEGRLYYRLMTAGSVQEHPALDLSFRLIGLPDFIDPGPPPACAQSTPTVVTATASFAMPPARVVVQHVSLTSDAGSVGSFSFARTSPDPDPVAWVRFHGGLAPSGLPDPGLVALRASPNCCPASPTAEQPGWGTIDLARPLVLESLPGTNDVSDRRMAFELIGLDPQLPDPATATAKIGLLTGMPATTTSTLPPMYRDGPDEWQLLPIQPAVISHEICHALPADGHTLRAVQQVVRADEVLPAPAVVEALQTFRVPETCTIRWPEVAVSGGQTEGVPPLVITLMAPVEDQPGFDPSTVSVSLVTVTADAPLFRPPANATVMATFLPASELPTSVTLTPGVDYWIHMRTDGNWDLPAAATVTASTGRRLFLKPTFTLPMEEASDKELAYRLIGVARPLTDNSPTVTAASLVTNVTGTSTTDLRAGPGGRRVAQAIVVPTATALGSFQIPVGSDGGGVSITAGVRFVEELPNGAQTPSRRTYPLANVTVTASGGGMRWRTTVTTRPIVFRPIQGAFEGVSATAVSLEFEAREVQTSGRAKIALGPPTSVTVTAAVEDRGLGWTAVTGTATTVGFVADASSDPEATVLRVAQQVLTVGRVMEATATAQMVQVFRVPEPVRATWVELAIAGGVPATTQPMEVAIVDPGEQYDPPPDLLVPTATATLVLRLPEQDLGDAWSGSSRFTTPVELVPSKDYWLVVTPPSGWRMGVYNVTGTPYTEGRFYARATTTTAWTEVPGEDLCFRIIGRMASAVGVTPAPPVARVFTLRADPVPFSDELAFRWSGGTGRVQIEVFDVSGRRVRRVRDAGSALEGVWIWRGEDDAGHGVHAGVYFARVTPAGGRTLNRRIVYVH